MNFILWTVQSLLKVYLALYFVFHALVFFNPGFVKYMVFMNNVKLPFQNYQNPTEYGLNNVHNFYFNSESNVKIGVWHYVPEKLGYKFNERKDKSTKEHLSKFLKEPSTAAAPTVVIYAHGNDQDRASRFRRELCSNLVKMGYHVFALDYRGYGDSTGEPTETGVVKDLVELFELIRANAPNSRVFLYGHSLGSGVVSHAAKVLTDKKAKIDGVILEAPFLNASMASKDYILSLAFNNNKWIQGKTDEGLLQEKIFFNNDKHILEINSRMLIFHAEDDWFVPHYHGAKLKDISHNRPKHLPAVEFIPFEKAHGLGHFLQTHKPMYSRIKQLIDE